jgi:hypothetical protein
MSSPVTLPKLSKQATAKIAADFDKATRNLERVGFEQSQTTKSRIFTLTYLTKNAKGYVSIRYNADSNESFVLCEFYGCTRTLEKGLGIEARLIDFTPRLNNIVYYKGLDMARCRQHVILMAEFLQAGVGIYHLFSKF